jgi:hypothetical protein
MWVRAWRVGRSLAISGAPDGTGVSGLTLMLVMTFRHSAQHHPGRRVAAARSDSYPTAQATQAAKFSPGSRALPLGGGCGSNPR